MQLGFSKERGSGKKHLAYSPGGTYKSSKSQKKAEKALWKASKERAAKKRKR